MFAPTMRVVDGADPYSINPSIANRQNKKRHFHSVSVQTKFTPACPVSATPFRGGFATLNHPLGHAKVREKKSYFIPLKIAIEQYLPKHKKAGKSLAFSRLFIIKSNLYPSFAAIIPFAPSGIYSEYGLPQRTSSRTSVELT